MNEQTAKPWYREFWFWLVMAPLIMVVAASAVMVSIAVRYADDTVSDTYEKDSRMYHFSAHQDERARELQLAALLQFQRAETGEPAGVSLDLNGRLDAFPEQLLLTLSHPVEADLDRHILLKRVTAGHYIAALNRPLEHRWYLHLMPELHPDRHLKAEWRLKGEINFDQGDAVPLNPANHE